MFRSIDLSYSEQLPNRSRYAYNVSASYFTPAEVDVELDKAIENFAAMGLNGIAAITRQGGQYPHDPYQHSSAGRIQDAPYQGTYAGSNMADSYYSQNPQPPAMQPKAIDYPRSIAPSHIDSRISRASSSKHHHPSSSSSYYRKSQHAGGGGSQYNPYQNLQHVDELNNRKALTRYVGGGKSKKSKSRYGEDGVWDDVGPEDSISQVSTRVSSRREGYERRGRTRRREASMVSRSTVVPRGVGGGGGGQQQQQYLMGGGGGFVEPEFYYTRDITPW